MLKIKAHVKTIARAKIKPPDDGVHVAGRTGFIKGCHSLWFDDKLVPKGQTAFYWAGITKGIRVSYSFGWFKPLPIATVKRDYSTMKKCYALGVAPKPHGITKVALDLVYEHAGKKKRIKCNASGILVDHVHYQPEAWQAYAEGQPYDWGADDHPDHRPDGYRAFVKEAKWKVKGLIDTSWKLGDVLWCTNKKRFYLVDCGK